MKEFVLHNIKEIRLFLKDEKVIINYCPSFNELINLAEIKKDKVVLFSIKVDKEIVAIALFSENKRQIVSIVYNSLHLYGFDFFDYNPFYVKEKFHNQFIKLIKKYSKKNKLDLIILDNIFNNFNENYSFKDIQTVDVFDKNKSENGFNFIANKKSLKRHKKKLINNFNYSVRHFRSYEITEKLLDQFSEFHIERWGFDNVQSSFLSANRKKDFLNNIENKLLTIIMIDEEIFAMHFGMIYEDALIWHSPVLNIKFYEYSPIEVLLLETSIYCNKNNTIILDFGLGDEKYKMRFSNSNKDVFSYLIPLSSPHLSKLFLSSLLRDVGLKEFISFSKKTYLYIKSIYNSLNIYKVDFKFFEKTNPHKKNILFHMFSEYSELVDFFRGVKTPIKRHHYNRLKSGNEFYCLFQGNELVCSGWSTSKPVNISEVNKVLNVDGNNILYDFFTPSNFRNKGYYKCILENIILHQKKDSYIYTLKSNKASNKAIQNIGFKTTNEFQLR
mgnify:CR=1 FL=1|tara:strand:- start:3962 stop:5461 length:1500 start_codon:yes stop_codon:yes gene_type:complete